MSCPNINSSEWKALVEQIGEAAAWSDFISSGKIRSIEEIREEQAIRDEEAISKPTEAPINPNPVNHIKIPEVESVDDIIFDTQTLTDKEVIDSVAEDDSNNQNLLLKSMMERLDIDAEFVSPTKAKELTEESGNEWDPNKPAFFIGGKVYFVIGNSLTDSTVFHEFSHPFVRAISVENPALFEKLYNDIVNTTEGSKLKSSIENRYKFATGKSISASNQLKEELIVQALTEKANLAEPSTGFAKAIKNLLYQIKQFFRKTYGKNIKISKLAEDTSIAELADMMLNAEKITLPKSKISQDDVAAYLDERSEFIEDLYKLKDADIMTLVDKLYEGSSKQIDKLLNNNDYDELANILTDEYRKGDLQKIRTNVAAYRTKVRNLAENVKDENEYNKKKLKALMETFLTLDKVMRKIDEHMQDLKTRPDNQETMRQVHSYESIINYWEGLVETANEIMDDSRINLDSPVVKVISDINRSINRINDAKNEIYSSGARDTLYEQLEPMGRNLKERYDERIANLKEKNAPKERIEKLEKEYYGITEAENTRMKSLQKMDKAGTLSREGKNELKTLELASAEGLAVSPEKIEALLKGQAGDANFFNSFFEGYLYNTDPVIGGLALYVKNQTNDVLAKAQATYNSFADEINPLMDKAGINRNRPGEIGEKIGNVDTVSSRDEDGNIVEKQVWTITDRFVNYRYPYDLAQDAVEKAHSEYSTKSTPANKEALLKAVADFEQLRRDYYYDQYTEAYYKRTDIFNKDEMGKRAKNAREEIMEQINALTERANPLVEDQELSDEIKSLWRKYSQLGSLFYLDGTAKVDDPSKGIYDLSIAKKIKEYSAMTRDMYDVKPRREAFQSARNAYRESLIDKGITPDNPITEDAYYSAIRNWDSLNTTIIIKPSYYARRQKILDRIQLIMKKLPQKAADEENQGKIWKDIFDLTKGRDENGHVDALSMTQDARDKVKKLQELLADIKSGKVKSNGLTKEQNAKLNALYEFKNNVGNTVFFSEHPKLVEELNDLKAKKKRLGLSEEDRNNLQEEYAKLAEMMDSDPTDQYLDVFNNLLSTLSEEVIDKIKLKIGANTIDKTTADLLTDDQELINELKEESPEFAEWFDKNHLENTFYDVATKSQKTVYKRTYVWTITKPSDPNDYQTYDILDENGEYVETLAGVPSNEYTSRVLKKRFLTKRVVGETVDNKGNWLPKTEEAGAKDTRFYNPKYDELKKDPAMFELMEAIKRNHLKNQEGLNYRSRLYLDFPRFRKSRLEVIQSRGAKQGDDDEKNKKAVGGNLLSIWAKRFKEFWKGSADDAQSGLNDKKNFDLVRADMFDNEMTSVPIAGLYDIDINDVSTNITETMMKYMMSGERQKALIKALPTAQAIQSVVKSNEGAIKDTTKINKEVWQAKGIFKFLRKNKKGDKGVREKAIDNFIEREFEGKRNTGAGSNSVKANNIINLLFKRASFSFFALNIPSAMKNMYSAKFQGMIEASAGSNYNHVDFQKGNAWAYATMGELSFGSQLYKKGSKSLRQQTMEIFDPSQDRFADKFGEGLSRTKLSDTVSGSWLYSPRKWMELQATTQIFGGMMYKQKVMQKLSDGTMKQINYMEAWEVDENNQIRLKSGIDIRWSNAPKTHVLKSTDTVKSLAEQYNIPEDQADRAFKFSRELIDTKIANLNKERAKKLRNLSKPESAKDQEDIDAINESKESINNFYDSKIEEAKTITINNTEFKFYKNKMQQVMNNLQGTYAKFDQPEAQRYIAFRFISYLRRYFTSMTVNRWGHSGKIWDPKPRLNPGIGDVQMGYYVQFLNSIKQTIAEGGKNLQYMDKTEKAAAMKVITEMGMLVALMLVASLLFGWDPDDEEKWKKLREKSGPAGFFGLTDSDREFNFGGYMSNHALYMLWMVHAENKQFIPLPGFGLDEMTSMLDIKSVVTGPTVNTYVSILNNTIDVMKGEGTYSRDVGPYRWQKEGSSKVWNDFGKLVGISGSSLDPAKGMKGSFTAVAMARR